MPVFKLWNASRTVKKFVVASSVEDVIKNGAKKLSFPPCVHNIDVTLVLNEDGTAIDEDEVLMECKKNTLLLLLPTESWSPDTLHDSEIISSRDASDTATSSAPTVINPLPTVTSVTAPCAPRACELSFSHSPKSNPICVDILVLSGDEYINTRFLSETFTVPLPSFSTFVEDCLKSGKVLNCFGNLIGECAHFYLNKYPISSSSQYQEVGEQIYRKFPCTKFSKGSEPWTLFCEKLSQRMRNMRFQQKRKSGKSTIARSPKQPKFMSESMSITNSICTPISDEDYKKHILELGLEIKKSKPNKDHIRLLVKETHSNRRTWLSKQPASSWAPLIKMYPCFEDIDLIIYEYCLMQNKEDIQAEKNNLETLFKIIDKNYKKIQGADTKGEIGMIQHLEKATAFDKGKGRKTESIITIKKDVADEDIPKLCASKELAAPKLVCFTIDDKMVESAIVGDGEVIFCKADTVLYALLCLVLLYYVTDLEFPRQYSQLLGFLQQYVIKENFSASVSGKFVKFCHFVDSELDKVDK